MSSLDVGCSFDWKVHMTWQDTETKKNVHSFLAVQEDTSVLEKDIKTDGSGPGWRRWTKMAFGTGHGLFFFFLNKSEISEAASATSASIFQACIPGQESCALWVVLLLLFLGGHLFVLFFE